jgi:RNA polymerase-binding transcription factor DksA
MEGLSREDLEHFRKLLFEERKRVLEELEWVETNYIGKSRRDSAGDVSSYSMHPADMGTDSIEMEKAYMIGAASGAVLEDIDEALRDIDNGAYGRCVECEQPIPRERLEGVPHARLCIACKTRLEGSRGATR